MQRGSPMDKIHIEGLEVFALIGVYDWEREHKQRLIVDVELSANLGMAAQTDDVDNTGSWELYIEVLSNISGSGKLVSEIKSAVLDAKIVEDKNKFVLSD